LHLFHLREITHGPLQTLTQCAEWSHFATQQFVSLTSGRKISALRNRIRQLSETSSQML